MTTELAENIYAIDMILVAMICAVFGFAFGIAWITRKRLHHEDEKPEVLCGYHAGLLDRPFFNRVIDGANCQECAREKRLTRTNKQLHAHLRSVDSGDDRA